ncbi:MAG: cytosine deaminase-like metal-dependent hydrolase [Hydrocarboniphaga sp.]|uniref:amidohydrolase family protein n=1 Tax=Hydrocarboniphaga sp. TaxID=2033016 RepID=UPI0026078143|nr:amidohydrolase family protein [Hydrocarboniphaga sp.]MDB5973053.1 cytosine deaminase-like metal-dependent hydrolase [Hydrocarboniphaga sp.]
MDARLVNAALVSPQRVSRAPLHLAQGRIAAAAAVAGGYQVDLRDHLIFPGLINAHEHLHQNAIPPLKSAAPFPNSYAWIAAFQAHFDDPAVIAALSVPKALRHRHGGLKNLLAGTTCVAHHDPWHAALDAADFPVGLLRDYGWSYAPGWRAYGPPIRQSFHATARDRPWLVHLAEGTDATAAAELRQLAEAGCLAANSVLIHGVGMGDADVGRVIAANAAVVWCPGSNLSLLGRTLAPRRLFAAGCLALGSDSRLSGASDLLQELILASEHSDLAAQDLLRLVTTDAARILRLPTVGGLAPGQQADLVIVGDRGGDPYRSLVGIGRGEIRAVVRGGLPMVADADFADWFAACGIQTVSVTLDGKPKLLAKSMADAALIALEPGLGPVDI